MKLISISTVKNEADIIESFVRYHANIFDLMIVLDNGSTDDTLNILDQLVSEGLPVIVLIDDDKYFEPKIKYTFLLNKAFKEYGADIVCPLDADEFMTSTEGNPRELLEGLPQKSYFTVMWKTYVPTENDDENDLFVPSRIKYIRDEDIEHLGKVVVPKELFENYDAEVSIGNHDLVVRNDSKKEITNIRDSKLRIAHFPLRTIDQTMAKVLTNYPNSLSRTVVKKNTSYHYVIMFNKIKRTGSLEMSDVTEFAKNYSLRHNKERKDEFKEVEIDLYEDPMDLSFCKDIEIRYGFEENPLAIVLENNLYFAHEIHNFKNEKINLNKKIQNLENEKANLNKEIRNLESEKVNLNEEIHNLENEIKIIEDKNEEQQKEIAAKNELIEDVLSKTKKNIKSKDSGDDGLKKKMMDKALSKSNSYNYYRTNFEKLSDDNEKLHDINVHLMAENKQYVSDNKKLSKKNRKLRKKISKLRKNN